MRSPPSLASQRARLLISSWPRLAFLPPGPSGAAPVEPSTPMYIPGGRPRCGQPIATTSHGSPCRADARRCPALERGAQRYHSGGLANHHLGLFHRRAACWTCRGCRANAAPNTLLLQMLARFKPHPAAASTAAPSCEPRPFFFGAAAAVKKKRRRRARPPVT